MKRLLDILACPKCKGSLKKKNKSLICENCSLEYRIEDKIIRLIIDEAKRNESVK